MHQPDPSERGATRPSPVIHTDGPARERPPTRRSATAHPRGREGRTGMRPRAVVPASVWAPDSLVDPDAAWPEPILARIVTTLSTPGQTVTLLTDRPASEDPPGPAYGTAAAAVVPPGTLAAARELIEAHDRHARIAHSQPDPGDETAEPFWARFVHPAHTDNPESADLARGDSHHHGLSVPEPPHAERQGPAEPAALVVAALDPTGAGEQFGFTAAELLRDGGTLAVITHCDHQQGRLRDPSGSLVASAQNADLIYLQHIVALHHPITTGHLTRTRRRETGGVRRHRRVHSDVYLFGRHGQQAAALTQQLAA